MLFESLRGIAAELFALAKAGCCSESGSDAIHDEAGDAELWFEGKLMPMAADAPVGGKPLSTAANDMVNAGLGKDRSEG